MDSTLKVTELVTPKNKYKIFYYIIPVSFGSPYIYIHSVILSVLDPRKCEYLKDNSLDFEHAYLTTYLAL